MKEIVCILMLSTLSCNSQVKQANNTTIKDTIEQVATILKTSNSKYYTTKDILIITTEIGDTLQYYKNDFNKIVDKHSEFFKIIPIILTKHILILMTKKNLEVKLGKTIIMLCMLIFLNKEMASKNL